MKNKKISVGVTGNIGSGKSTFCNYIRNRDYAVINADELAKEILAENEPVKKKIIRAFGTECYANGKLNKRYLANSVFSNPSRVEKINSIVHPIVADQIKKQLAELFKSNSIVFTEAALIYEADMEDQFDYVVLITAETDIRMKRVTGSGKLPAEDFLMRDSNQIAEEEKKKRADFIFQNDGSETDLNLKADFLLMMLTNL